MPQKADFIPLRGGLDIVTPAVSVGPGFAIAAKNYESNVKGYARVEGYERFDGQPKPSTATVVQLAFDSGSTEPSPGDRIDGGTSGAYGFLLEAPTVTNGTWGGGDAAGTMLLRHLSGTFQNNEDLEVSASAFASADGTTNAAYAATDTEAETDRQAAVEQARDDIAAPTGSGAIRGGFVYNGDVYAFRDNAGATAGGLHKATTAGWVAQTFGSLVAFTSGTAEFLEGETLTGGSSGASATIMRVVKQSGSWGSTAAGYLVVGAVTSGPFQAETGTSASGSATIAAESAITLPAGGRYRCIEHNFFGRSYLSRVYFTNEVGYAHEWDGTSLVPIRTGASASVDKPTHVGVQANHLVLGYLGGSVFLSGTGNPLSFDANDGAAEVSLGQTISNIHSDVRGSTIIASRTRIGYLTGTSANDFQLDIIAPDSGAEADTMAVIGEPHFLDQRGVRALTAAQEFGNWQVGTVTRLVEPYIEARRASGATSVGALRVRKKDQYRLFWSDGSGLNIYFGRGDPEPMPIDLGFTPACFWSGEDTAGRDILFAGASDGMVYQLDSGQSWDGEEMEYFLRLPFNHQGAPYMHKRYHRVTVEVETDSASTALSMAAIAGYGANESPEGSEQTFTGYGSLALWDLANWDQFAWDAPAANRATVNIQRIGENVSVLVSGASTYENPHRLTAVNIYFTPRRQRR